MILFVSLNLIPIINFQLFMETFQFNFHLSEFKFYCTYLHSTVTKLEKQIYL